MKPIALLGLISLFLVPACGDSGGATDSNTASDTSMTSGTSATATEPTGTTAVTTSATSSGSTTASDSTGDSVGQTTGPNATTTTDATTTEATTDASTTTTDATTSTTEPGTSGSSTGGPIGEPLTITLKDVFVYANCQPIVDPDHIIGFWTVVYDNSQGLAAGAAELIGSTLHLSLNDNPSEHDITVDPTHSGPVPAGMTIEQEQKKQKGPPTPGCGICDTPYRLDLVFSSGGVDVPISHEGVLGCVY